MKGMIKDFILNSIAAGVLCHRRLRMSIYRLYGAEIPTDCEIKPRCYLGLGKGHLKVGGGAFVNYKCWFDLGADIVIGDKCNIAMNVTFMNSDHDMADSERRAGVYHPKPIIVGDGCWIGANSLIMPGVTIGTGVVIAAGSVVTKDCESDCLYGGVPAKKIKEL